MEEIGEKILNSIYGGNDPIVSIFGSIGPDDIEKLVTEFQDSPWAQLLKQPHPQCKKTEENPWVKLFTSKEVPVQKVNIPCKPEDKKSMWSHVLNKEKTQYPPVDIRVMETFVEVHIDIPAVSKENIKLSIKGSNELIIEYERKQYSISSDTFVMKERPTGLIKRSIKLPDGIDTNPKSIYDNGVLTLLFNKLSSVDDQNIKRINIL